MTITVSLNQDTVVEGEEEFGAIISLQGAIPGVQLGSDTASATIADDDGKGEARTPKKAFIIYSFNSFQLLHCSLIP